MRQPRARELALALPETEASSPHGRDDARVRGKIFVTFPPDGTLVLKTTPADLAILTGREPEIFRRVWGERWVGVDIEPLGEERVVELLNDAWRLAAPASLRRALDDD